MARSPSNGTTRLIVAAIRAMTWCTDRNRWREARLVSWVAKLVTGVEMHPGVRIGPGLLIMHGQSLVVGGHVVMGRDCVLHHEVSLGYRHEACPTLGDRVIVYPGAKVVGGITIGDDAIIGANAVVLDDVPAGGRVFAPRSVLREG